MKFLELERQKVFEIQIIFRLSINFRGEILSKVPKHYLFFGKRCVIEVSLLTRILEFVI